MSLNATSLLVLIETFLKPSSFFTFVTFFDSVRYQTSLSAETINSLLFLASALPVAIAIFLDLQYSSFFLDFRIFDSNKGAIHNWASIRLRPTNSMSVYLKYSFTNYFEDTTIAESQTQSGYWISNPTVNNRQSDYKIQVNYAF